MFFFSQKTIPVKVMYVFKLSNPLPHPKVLKKQTCPFWRWIALTVCQWTALGAHNDTFSASRLNEHTQLYIQGLDEHWLFSKVKIQPSMQAGLISEKGRGQGSVMTRHMTQKHQIRMQLGSRISRWEESFGMRCSWCLTFPVYHSYTIYIYI